MRTIETALWPLEQPSPDGGLGVFLGETHSQPLAGVREGERVLLVEANELEVEATVRQVEVGGNLWWFGEIDDPDSVRVIYPGPQAVPTPPATG